MLIVTPVDGDYNETGFPAGLFMKLEDMEYQDPGTAAVMGEAAKVEGGSQSNVFNVNIGMKSKYIGEQGSAIGKNNVTRTIAHELGHTGGLLPIWEAYTASDANQNK